MFETPAEDYEIRCEKSALELVRFMDNVMRATIEDSHADEFGDDDYWNWSGKIVLEMDIPNRVYRVPVFCEDESGDVGIGDSECDGGDRIEDVWRWMLIDEIGKK